MKSFKKFFSILFVCVLLSLTVCSDYISCYNVNASGGITDYIDALTNYFLTVTGAVNKPSSHSSSDHIEISPVPSTSRNAIKQKISDLINNNGIYESNGQYIFTSSAMDELYYILNGNSSSNFRVINDYSAFDYQINNDIGVYFNSTVLNNIQSVITSAQNTGNPYLLCACGYKASYKPNMNVADYVSYTFYAIILNDNVSFIDYTNNSYNYNQFKNSSGQVLNLTGYQTGFTYEGVRSNPYSYNNPSSSNYYNTLPTGLTVNATAHNYIANNFPTVLNYEDTAPGTNSYYPDGIYLNCLYYCTNSLIFAKGVTAFNSSNINSGIIYFNNYNNITVDNSVVNNNDWNSVYNSYVTNVNNTYQTEVTNNNGSDLTSKQVRQIMTTYLTPIYNAIEDGLTDIAEKVDYINEWLYKIYQNQGRVVTRLDQIIQIITNSGGGSGSGGSSSVWTAEQVAIVVDKITRLYTEQADSNIDIVAALEYLKTRVNNVDGYTSDILDNSNTIVTDLATINTALDTIADKLDDLGGGVDITLPNIPLDVIDDIIDLLTNEVDDIVDSLDVVGNVLETAVPFCFLAAFGAIINGLSATPVEPEALTWEIPFESGDGVVDEVFVIDWSFLDSIHSIWISFVVIVFVIGLMALSFRIFATFGTLIN